MYINKLSNLNYINCMLYIDMSLYSCSDVIEILIKLNKREKNVTIVLIYSYETTKISNELLIATQNHKDLIIRKFNDDTKNIKFDLHMGVKNSIFIIKENIIKDIQKYQPNNIHVLTEYNEFIDKILYNNKCYPECFYYTKLK